MTAVGAQSMEAALAVSPPAASGLDQERALALRLSGMLAAQAALGR